MATSKRYPFRKDSAHSDSVKMDQDGPYNDWFNDSGFETAHEQRSEVELQVEGTIPPYAAGTLYRTGPGGKSVVTSKGTTWTPAHWFDGLSKVHRFVITADGDGPDGTVRVRYNSRQIVDQFIEKIREEGHLNDFSFARKNDPCQSYFRKLMSFFMPEPKPVPRPNGSRNIGVTLSVNVPGMSNPVAAQTGDDGSRTKTHGVSSLWAKTDANGLQRIDPETLEPIGLAEQTSLHPDLKGPLTAAHARTDPETGDFFSYNLEFGRLGTYRVFKVSAATGETTILATISGPSAYIHSFFLTADFVIICAWTSHFIAGGLSILWNRNILDSIAPFNKRKTAKWYIIDRRHGKGLVATYESPAFFAFHSINAWQEPSQTDPEKTDIVAEIPVYENLDILHRFYYNNLLSTLPTIPRYQSEKGESVRPSLRRYRLPNVPPAGTPLPSRCSPPLQARIDYTIPRKHSLELPIINSAYLTRPHRYTYGTLDRGLSSFVDGLLKFDSSTREPLIWSQHGHSPGEPIFVADPAGTAEDDGVLLSVVLDGEADTSYLLVLDARNMKELGRAFVDGVVSFGFHGVYVPEGRIISTEW